MRALRGVAALPNTHRRTKTTPKLTRTAAELVTLKPPDITQSFEIGVLAVAGVVIMGTGRVTPV